MDDNELWLPEEVLDNIKRELWNADEYSFNHTSCITSAITKLNHITRLTGNTDLTQVVFEWKSNKEQAFADNCWTLKGKIERVIYDDRQTI